MVTRRVGTDGQSQLGGCRQAPCTGQTDYAHQDSSVSGDNDDGTCVCGQPVAGTNTLCCYDCLEAQEYAEMMEDD